MFDSLRIGSKAKEAQKYVPVHPNPAIGDKHGVHLLLHGKYSEVYRNAMADMLRRTKGKEQSPEEIARESAIFIADCCAGYVTPDDKKPEFSREKLIETLEQEDYRWLRLGAEKFMTSDTPFF